MKLAKEDARIFAFLPFNPKYGTLGLSTPPLAYIAFTYLERSDQQVHPQNIFLIKTILWGIIN